MSGGGFVDLRLNEQHSGDEGFWPSFTDIMTVIVMIFLLAMLTLMVKNMDLVHQLRSSLDAERMASAQARSTTHINSELNQRLKHLEEEAAMLRMRLMNLGEEHSQTVAQLGSSQQENIRLMAQLAAMTQQRDISRDAKAALEQQQAALLQKQSDMEKKQTDLTALLAQRLQQLNAQQQQYQLKEEELGTLKSQHITQLERLKKLELEYASLDKKYHHLIRPARSSLGKVVTMVRYHKQDGVLLIEVKGPKDAQYHPVNGTQLHKELTALQQKHGKKLYVRIVFPDDSGLSYTEAWNLTESLLRLYDYYYQE